MDHIILGLLMMKAMTGYEVRSFIKHHLSLMCSDSAGSFQAALQKLLSAKMITCNEYVEKGVNKKLYAVTDAGRRAFFQWEEQPMNHRKAKNIELAKLFFLGTLEDEKRTPLLHTYIMQLTQEQERLIKLKEEVLSSNADYLNEFAHNRKVMDKFKYQMAALDYGIASFRFEIQWYSQFVRDVEEEGVS